VTGCLACAAEEIARAEAAGDAPDAAAIAEAVTWAPSVQVQQVNGKTAAAISVVPSCLRHLQPDKNPAPLSRSGLATG
jgi:hypothetical protein